VPRTKTKFVPLQDALPAVVAELVRAGPMSHEKLSFVWHRAVGDAIARATRVRLDAGGVLRVAASDGRWKREIQRSAAVILTRLQALVGSEVVSQLDVVVSQPESRIAGSRRSPWTPPSS